MNGSEMIPSTLPTPVIQPPLDGNFRPAALAYRAYQDAARTSGTSLQLALERGQGEVSRFEMLIFPEGHPRAAENYPLVERTLKFLLWQRGAHTVWISGNDALAAQLAREYGPRGSRRFDWDFLGRQVYERPFRILPCAPQDLPPSRESPRHLGRHLKGCRIGFDLGASDRKVSAVIDGTPVYSEEVIWEPRKQADPTYHYREIMAAIQSAAAHLPRVDAIGGSAAGIYIENRPMVASLFRSVPEERFDEVHNLFLRIQQEMGVPLEILNDGDVTALAGSMAIGENSVLGIALGSSEAAGYVNPQGLITGWLNELAFAPVDYAPHAPIEEWSGDRGCGASYLSQQCVFRLAPAAGVSIPEGLPDAEKLAHVQSLLATGHEGAVNIWRSMGVYLGYALAHYAHFYEIRHVLILGRCTSGEGGNLLLEGCKQVWEAEFPALLERVTLHLPDEKIRRVGQSVAAASLPEIRSEES
ncbi:transcriptional regulator [Anaerolinea thermolimosa]|uniref:ROK family protein n=1 Tax=Anaerolinea thermolimosa TaxID=229919 RepID=UPI000A95167F|nr:ROK family protein [Anaerolinea thermolimosa]GAP07805.1 transcriptional regulator [Anaerolinea thermolimosa]